MKILVAEDNIELANALEVALKSEGHGINVVHNGHDADLFCLQEHPDLILLDINMPGKSGLEVLSALRQCNNSTPVLLITARGDTKDRVAGLDLGADDYLVKPFDMGELLARVRALLRRTTYDQTLELTAGSLTLEQVGKKVFCNGEPLALPRREFALLELFITRIGQVLPKERVLDHLYGTGSDSRESAVELYVHRLRKRLVGSGLEIKTYRGLGYSLEETD